MTPCPLVGSFYIKAHTQSLSVNTFVFVNTYTMRKIQNVWSCIKKLRGYEGRRLRFICYYHSFYGGTMEIRKAQEQFCIGERYGVTNQIEKSYDVLERCYNDGFCLDVYEYRCMVRTLDVFRGIVERWWWLVWLFDCLTNKKHRL